MRQLLSGFYRDIQASSEQDTSSRRKRKPVKSFTHRVDVDEEAVFFLVGAESLNKVQQDRVGVVEVGVGDEHGGVWGRGGEHGRS